VIESTTLPPITDDKWADVAEATAADASTHAIRVRLARKTFTLMAFLFVTEQPYVRQGGSPIGT
jgi:hypothetical protein